MLEFHTGDIVLTRGLGFIGKVIKFVTNSEFSHVGMIIRTDLEDGYVLVAEAQWTGFVITKYHTTYLQEQCKVGRVFDILGKELREAIRRNTLKLVGKPYDFKALLLILKSMVTGKDLVGDGDNSLICSEGVARIYLGLGVDLVPGKRPGLVTPADISKSKEIHWMN